MKIADRSPSATNHNELCLLIAVTREWPGKRPAAIACSMDDRLNYANFKIKILEK